jgi:segregation and condensation protein A
VRVVDEAPEFVRGAAGRVTADDLALQADGITVVVRPDPPADGSAATALAEPPAVELVELVEGPPRAPDPAVSPPGGFEVHLDNFEGPFDLLLGLIAKHKLDVTEIALAKVTDDFVAWIRARGPQWDLDDASEFLLVAATLLDLKAARLLPAAEVEDDDDLALLEARDLLFARLLQYRAFKDVAATFSARLAAEARRMPRAVAVEPHFAQLLPELVLGITADQLAAIAARAMTPKPVPTVGLDHLHAPAVSVREQAALIVGRLRRIRSASFRALIADTDATVVVVARFLALLELFREGVVSFDQLTPLGELTIRWTGTDEGEVAVVDEFDAGAPEAPAVDPVVDPAAPAGEDGGRDPGDDDRAGG